MDIIESLTEQETLEVLEDIEELLEEIENE